MAEAVELAVGYVSIVPETSKVGPGIERSLAESAGRIAKFGSIMGSELGKGIAVGVAQGAGTAFDDVVSEGSKAGGKAGDRAGRDFTEHVVKHSRKAGRDSGKAFFDEFKTTSDRSGAIMGKILAAPMVANVKAFHGAGHLAARTFRTAFTLGVGSLGLGTALSLTGILGKGLERQMGLDSANKQLARMDKQFQSTGKAGLDVNKIMSMLTNGKDGILDSTPFALNEAMGAVTLALQGGVEQGKQLTQYMTALTDAAGATQQPFSELASIFNDIVTKGRLESDEIDQLRNRMIDIPTLLKDAYGWNNEQLADAIKNGKVGINEVTEAIEKNMGGAAKTAGDTLQGAIENVGNAAGRVGAKLINAFSGKDGDPLGGAKDVVQAVTNQLNNMGKWIDANKDTIRRWFDTAREVAADFLGVIKNIAGFLADSPTLVRNIAIAFAAWEGISVIATIGATLGNAYNSLKGIKGLLTAGGVAKDVADVGAAAATRRAVGAGAAGVAADAIGGPAIVGGAAAAGGSIVLPVAALAAGSAAAVGIATMLFDRYVQSAAGQPVDEQIRQAVEKLEAERAAQAERDRNNAGLRGLLGASEGPIIGEGPNFYNDWYPSVKRALWGPDGLLSALDLAALKAKGVNENMVAVFEAEQAVGAELATLVEDPQTIVLKDNTPEVLENIDTVNYEVTHLENGELKVVPKTEEAKRILDQFIAAQSDREITPKVVPEVDAATEAVNVWRRLMGATPVTVPLVARLQDVLFPGIGGAGGSGGGIVGPGGAISPGTLGGLLGNVAGSPGQGFPTPWNLNAGGMFGGGGNGISLQSGNWQGIDAVASSQFGLSMTSGFRDPNGPPAGAAGVPANKSYHGTGQAHDFAGTPEQMAAFAQYMATNFGGQIKELIYGGPGWNPANNINNGAPHSYDEVTLQDHGLNNPDNAHVHVAFADGGGISGPGTSTSDSIPAMLSDGEHVLTAADVQAMGGQSGVYAFRNALHRAGGGPIFPIPDVSNVNWAPGINVDDNQQLTPQVADAEAQKDTSTGRYNQTIPGHAKTGRNGFDFVPTELLSTDPKDYGFGPGNFNPNIILDPSSFSYVGEGKPFTYATSPLTDTYSVTDRLLPGNMDTLWNARRRETEVWHSPRLSMRDSKELYEAMQHDNIYPYNLTVQGEEERPKLDDSYWEQWRTDSKGKQYLEYVGRGTFARGGAVRRYAPGGAVDPLTPEEVERLKSLDASAQAAYDQGKRNVIVPPDRAAAFDAADAAALLGADPGLGDIHQGSGAAPGPDTPGGESDQPPSFLENLFRSKGFTPTGGGGVAGTSSLAKLVQMPSSVVAGAIDTGTGLAKMAASAAITAGVAAGSFGAAAPAAPIGNMAAGYGIDLAGAQAKVISNFWLGSVPGIAADALMAQMPLASLFGPSRLVGYDYTQFMPQLGIQQAATTTIEQMGQKAINDWAEGQKAQSAAQPGGPVNPNPPAGQQANSGPSAPVMQAPEPGQGMGPPPGPPPQPSSIPSAPVTPDGAQQQNPLLSLMPSVFDQGGMLQPGQLGINMTNRPEPVLTAQQWDSLKVDAPSGQGAPLVKIDAIYGMSPEDVANQIEQKQRLAAMQFSGRPYR